MARTAARRRVNTGYGNGASANHSGNITGIQRVLRGRRIIPCPLPAGKSQGGQDLLLKPSPSNSGEVIVTSSDGTELHSLVCAPATSRASASDSQRRRSARSQADAPSDSDSELDHHRPPPRQSPPAKRKAAPKPPSKATAKKRSRSHVHFKAKPQQLDRPAKRVAKRKKMHAPSVPLKRVVRKTTRYSSRNVQHSDSDWSGVEDQVHGSEDENRSDSSHSRVENNHHSDDDDDDNDDEQEEEEQQEEEEEQEEEEQEEEEEHSDDDHHDHLDHTRSHNHSDRHRLRDSHDSDESESEAEHSDEDGDEDGDDDDAEEEHSNDDHNGRDDYGRGDRIDARREHAQRRAASYHDDSKDNDDDESSRASEDDAPPANMTWDGQQRYRLRVLHHLRDSQDLPSIHSGLVLVRETHQDCKIHPSATNMVHDAELAMKYLIYKDLMRHFSRSKSKTKPSLFSKSKANKIVRKIFEACDRVGSVHFWSEPDIDIQSMLSNISKADCSRIDPILRRIMRKNQNMLNLIRAKLLPDDDSELNSEDEDLHSDDVWV